MTEPEAPGPADKRWCSLPVAPVGRAGRAAARVVALQAVKGKGNAAKRKVDAKDKARPAANKGKAKDKEAVRRR